MAIPISLKDIVEELDKVNEQVNSYLNRQTGELVLISEMDYVSSDEEEDLSKLPQWQQEVIVKNREVKNSMDYIQLPDSYDLNEYKIMEDFCYSIEEEKTRKTLLSAIDGRGAVQRFKESLHALNIVDEWNRFRYKAYEEIAIEWLETNQIPFTRN